jgi:hypothetical protein
MIWTGDELDAIGATTELDIAPLRADGSPRRYTTIWVVRVGDGLYVRSYRGPDGSWYGGAMQSGRGRIRVSGTEHDVRFEAAGDVDRTAVEDAYRAKYGRSSYVDAMVTDDAAATTLRLIPN